MRLSAVRMTAHDWAVMSALMIGVFLSPLNVSFTSVALPTMRDSFAVSVEQATWIATAYFIPSVVLMPLQAYIGERSGIRNIYTLGLILLSSGSFLAAVAPTFGWMLASRVLQGIGWSALYPLALILIRAHYPAKQQGEMMGLWESSVGVATIIAPVTGGAIVQFLGWPFVYVVIGFVAGTGAVITLLVIPSRTEHDALPDFDWLGAITMTLSLTLLLSAVTLKSLILAFGGLVAGLIWLWFANRNPSPFIAPAILFNRRFLGASSAANLRMMVALAALMALPLFFEDVQGLSPSLVGTLMVIYSVFLFLSAWPGGRWADRAGARTPGVVGYLAMIAGVLLLLLLDVRLSVLVVAVALAIRGVGAGLTQAPFAKVATGAVQPQHSRSAAGLYGTIRYSGLALGSALVGIFLEARLNHYGALQGGPLALPAYREFWILLTALAVIGLGMVWLIGQDPKAEPVALPVEL